MLRRFLHWAETGSQGKLNSFSLPATTDSGMVRLQKNWSCCWRTSFAKSAEEVTIVVFWPSFRVIKGPCVLASLAKDFWGL